MELGHAGGHRQPAPPLDRHVARRTRRACMRTGARAPSTRGTICRPTPSPSSGCLKTQRGGKSTRRRKKKSSLMSKARRFYNSNRAHRTGDHSRGPLSAAGVLLLATASSACSGMSAGCCFTGTSPAADARLEIGTVAASLFGAKMGPNCHFYPGVQDSLALES